MENITIIGNGCVGCRSCELVCPVNAIWMEQNHEGFLYPKLNEKICIQCGLCLKKCAQTSEKDKHEPLGIFALKNKDRERVQHSASAGVSDIAANIILEDGGVVFGSAYNEEFYVEHIMVEEKSDLRRIQSSKYVQSDLRRTFIEARERLNDGRKVLFTGTPCQIDALRVYLGRAYANLFTIDLICHGVPSPKFFEKYLDYEKKKMGGELIEFNFRSKEKGGWGTQEIIKTKTKTKTKTLRLDRYGKHFMEGNCYRECCYNCQYSNTSRVGDITIGDFWSINKYYPDFYSSDGVSVVFVNSEKGNRLFKRISDFADIIPSQMDAALSGQGNLVHPTRRPVIRDSFYEGIDSERYIEKLKVGLQAKERIKALLPKRLMMFLKRVAK